MKRRIPDFFTLLNLFCGCIAIVCAFYNQYMLVPYFVIGSYTADFLDGMAARALNTTSEIGKELDSLADMVSFGVLPGVLVFLMLQDIFQAQSIANTFSPVNAGIGKHFGAILTPALLGFLITLGAAFRLAKFNIQAATDSFRGLSTPPASGFFFGIYMLYHGATNNFSSIVSNPYFLIGCVVVITFFMNAPLDMISNKVKNFKWRGNELRWVMFLIFMVLLFTTGWAAFSLMVLIYVIISLLQNTVRTKPN